MPARWLSSTDAVKRVRASLSSESVSYSERVRDMLAKARMSALDVENVLRCGVIREKPKLEGTVYRYFVETERMCVVVSFYSQDEMEIVEGWRK